MRKIKIEGIRSMTMEDMSYLMIEKRLPLKEQACVKRKRIGKMNE